MSRGKPKQDKKLIRANAIIDMLRIFYPNQVERAERLCDLAMKTEDNKPFTASGLPVPVSEIASLEENSGVS